MAGEWRKEKNSSGSGYPLAGRRSSEWEIQKRVGMTEAHQFNVHCSTFKVKAFRKSEWKEDILFAEER